MRYFYSFIFMIMSFSLQTQAGKMISFVSHKAIYDISLDKTVFVDEGIQDVHGTSQIILQEKQDRWVYEQKTILYITIKDEHQHTSIYRFDIKSEEHKDSLGYSFSWESSTDDSRETLKAKGEMKLPTSFENSKQDPKKIQETLKKRYIQYTVPEFSRVLFNQGSVLLPLEHLQVLIQHALSLTKDEIKQYQNAVFDGSTEAKEVVSIDATIQRDTQTKLTPNIIIKKASYEKDSKTISFAEQLKKSPIFDIHFNVYPVGKRESTTPDYSYSQKMNEIGVVISSKTHYVEPEFSVIFTLKECTLL